MLLYNVFCMVVILTCVCINIMILMQKKRASGLSGTISGEGAQSTYWDKNKGRSREGALERYTKILGAVFIVVSLALNIVQ